MATQQSTAIWQQILATPGDKNLQQQYQEALAREGDSRAELFRVAEAKRVLIHGYFEREAELKRQYERLLAPWKAELDKVAKGWSAEVHFVHGWPIEVTITAHDFIEHAAEIIKVIPLRHLNLKAVNAAPEVFEITAMQQIASIDGSGQRWSKEAIAALAGSTQLESLKWLDLRNTDLTEAEVEILAAAETLRHVAHLDLQDNPCRNPVDASEGYGFDACTGYIVNESIFLPSFGRELEARYGEIDWLHALGHFMEAHPPKRYLF